MRTYRSQISANTHASYSIGISSLVHPSSNGLAHGWQALPENVLHLPPVEGGFSSQPDSTRPGRFANSLTSGFWCHQQLSVTQVMSPFASLCKPIRENSCSDTCVAGTLVRQGLCAIGGPLLPASPHLQRCFQSNSSARKGCGGSFESQSKALQLAGWPVQEPPWLRAWRCTGELQTLRLSSLLPLQRCFTTFCVLVELWRSLLPRGASCNSCVHRVPLLVVGSPATLVRPKISAWCHFYRSNLLHSWPQARTPLYCQPCWQDSCHRGTPAVVSDMCALPLGQRLCAQCQHSPKRIMGHCRCLALSCTGNLLIQAAA